MNKTNRILWGIVLIAAGVVVALNVIGVADIDLLFDGWWTLFIIIPCAVGLFTERSKTGNLTGLALGVLLLLCCQNVLSFSMLWKLLIPLFLVVAGVKLLFGTLFRNRGVALFNRMKQEGHVFKNGTAVFSGCEMRVSGEEFVGGDLNAVFGGVDCDLREAIIPQDCAIRATAVFGGIDLRLPPNVNVKVSSTSIFGGVDNVVKNTDGAVTVYVNATCLFGGIDIQ